jgi:Flp pilus assembly protein TadG
VGVIARLNSRRNSGQSTVELVCGLFVLVPLVLVLFDLAVIVIGVQVNDQTCRQAARAAASGDPASADQRAQAVVARANQQGSSMLSNFTLMTPLGFTPSTVLADAQDLVPYGGTVSGTVTVQTEVDIHPFIVPYVYSGGAPLKFRSSQTFPFTHVVKNTAN